MKAVVTLNWTRIPKNRKVLLNSFMEAFKIASDGLVDQLNDLELKGASGSINRDKVEVHIRSQLKR